jgi:hypothetical protein
LQAEVEQHVKKNAIDIEVGPVMPHPTGKNSKKEVGNSTRKQGVSEDLSGWTADTLITNIEARMDHNGGAGFMSRKISSIHPPNKGNASTNQATKSTQYKINNFTAAVSSINNKGINKRKSRQYYFSPNSHTKVPITVSIFGFECRIECKTEEQQQQFDIHRRNSAKSQESK